MDIYGQIEEFEYSQLAERYSIGSRQALLDRVNALRDKGLDIYPIKRGNKKFITGQELKWLDDLHAHLQQGGTLSNFSPTEWTHQTRTVDAHILSKSNTSGDTSIAPLEQVNLQLDVVREIFSEVRSLIPHLAPLFKGNTYPNYEQLDKAAERGWRLHTNHVTELIGVKPKGDAFNWGGGFVFFRIESKKPWWLVRKAQSSADFNL